MACSATTKRYTVTPIQSAVIKMEQHASDGKSQLAENKDKNGFIRLIYALKQDPTHPQMSKSREG